MLDQVYGVSELSDPEGMLAAVRRLEQLATSKKAFVSELRQLAQVPGILALIFSGKYSILRVDPRIASYITKTTTKGCMSTWSAKCWTCFLRIPTYTFLATLRPTCRHLPRTSSPLCPATSLHSRHQVAPTLTSIKDITTLFLASIWQLKQSFS